MAQAVVRPPLFTQDARQRLCPLEEGSLPIGRIGPVPRHTRSIFTAFSGISAYRSRIPRVFFITSGETWISFAPRLTALQSILMISSVRSPQKPPRTSQARMCSGIFEESSFRIWAGESVAFEASPFGITSIRSNGFFSAYPYLIAQR